MNRVLVILLMAIVGTSVAFETSAAGPAAATVLGEEIHTTDAAEMQEIIVTKLFDQFAAEQRLAADAVEIDAVVESMRRGMAAEGLAAEKDLKPEEIAEVNAMRRSMAGSLIRQWKINKALHGKYGGRIIYQQLGPEPLDAYRAFLKQRQAEGAFTIRDPAMADVFWRYFTDDSIHEFMAIGGVDEARAFSVPPWEQKPRTN